MKTLKHLFMLGLFCMISIGASAEVYSGSCGDNAQWSFDTTTGLLSITGSGKMTDYDYVFFPSAPWDSYRDYIITAFIGDGITSIGESAFRGCSGLTSVTIPNSVTSIGSSAFYNCSGLTSVAIPNSVTSIGGNAFYDCKGLTSVTIGNSVTSIGNYAFEYCSGLTSVNITDLNKWAEIEFGYGDANPLYYAHNLYLNGQLVTEAKLTTAKKIGSSAFYNCSGLTSVTIPNSVTSIGGNAFYGCKGLTNVTIPNSVTSIGDWAFSGCSGLTSVNITDLDKWAEIEFGSSNANPLYYAHNLYLNGQLVTEAKLTTAKKIGSSAFYNCSGLTSVTIPNSVTSIGEDAFYGCEGLTSVTIPNSVTSIGSEAFAYCSGLTSVTIPNSVTSIGSEAFAYCSGLTSVTIPNSVTSIGSGAFYDCSRLKSVSVEWKEASKIPSLTSSDFPYSTCYLYVPSGTKNFYSEKNYWRDFILITEGIKVSIEDKDGNDASIVVVEEGMSITLYDNINSISVPRELEDVNITYTRNFDKAGVWQAWYMPFDVAFDDMKEAYDVAQIHGVLLDKDNNAVLAFLKLDKGTVNANTPYVVRPKKSGEVAITTTTDLQPTVSKSFDLKSATDIYYLGGVYEQTTTPGSWYALNLDGQFQLMGSGVYLRPFRIYMTIDPRTDNPYAQSASTTAKMDIVVIGDDETMGIKESLTPALSEGKGDIYNLSGLRVTSIKSGQIYIMNGKKYIAK